MRSAPPQERTPSSGGPRLKAAAEPPPPAPPEPEERRKKARGGGPMPGGAARRTRRPHQAANGGEGRAGSRTTQARHREGTDAADAAHHRRRPRGRGMGGPRARRDGPRANTGPTTGGGPAFASPPGDQREGQCAARRRGTARRPPGRRSTLACLPLWRQTTGRRGPTEEARGRRPGDCRWQSLTPRRSARRSRRSGGAVPRAAALGGAVGAAEP